MSAPDVTCYIVLDGGVIVGPFEDADWADRYMDAAANDDCEFPDTAYTILTTDAAEFLADDWVWEPEAMWLAVVKADLDAIEAHMTSPEGLMEWAEARAYVARVAPHLAHPAGDEALQDAVERSADARMANLDDAAQDLLGGGS